MTVAHRLFTDELIVISLCGSERIPEKRACRSDIVLKVTAIWLFLFDAFADSLHDLGRNTLHLRDESRILLIQLLVEAKSELELFVERAVNQLVEEAFGLFHLLKVAADRYEVGLGLRAVVSPEAPRALAVAGAVMTVPLLILCQLDHILLVRVAQAEGAKGPSALIAGNLVDVKPLIESGEECLRLGGQHAIIIRAQVVHVNLIVEQLLVQLLVVALEQGPVEVL